MIRYHLLNGAPVEIEKASLGLQDIGILRGYGIFDFFLVRQGVPMFVEDYLDRFFRSAQILELEIPVSRDEFQRHLHTLLDLNKVEDTAIRLLLTGGYAGDGFTPAENPNWVIMQHPMPAMPTALYPVGIKLMLYRHVRELPEVKSTNYLTAIKIRNNLKQAGAPEVLYHDGRVVSESARSNFFILTKNGVLVTPTQNTLLGITRKQVIKIAHHAGIPVEERDISLDELNDASEAFLTSTIKGVLPVVQIDDIKIGDGKPGTYANQLRIAFERLTNEYIDNHRQ
jgi:branched-chain amino acid aminotransferase